MKIYKTKYDRINITLPEGLIKEVREVLKPTAGKLSTLIANILIVWLQGERKVAEYRETQ